MEYYATYLSKEIDIYRYCEYCIEQDEKDIDIDSNILDKIVQIINAHGFNIAIDRTQSSLTTIEIFNHKATIEREDTFPPHREKEEFPNTVTFCCCVKNTCKGGELGFYELFENKPSILVNTNDTNKMAHIVFFNDKIMHTGQPFSNGVRQLVSIHINIY